MPIMGGIEATKLIRDKNSTIPIVALTANAMKDDIEKTKEAGMDEHLSKPMDVQKFYETLLRYITKKNIELSDIKTIEKKESLDADISELFLELEKAIKSKQPLKCKPIIKKLDSCELSEHNNMIFTKIKNFAKRYKYVSAEECLKSLNY